MRLIDVAVTFHAELFKIEQYECSDMDKHSLDQNPILR